MLGAKKHTLVSGCVSCFSVWTKYWWGKKVETSIGQSKEVNSWKGGLPLAPFPLHRGFVDTLQTMVVVGKHFAFLLIVV